MPLGTSGEVGTLAPLQHQAFDAGMADAMPKLHEFGLGGELQLLGDINTAQTVQGVPAFEPRPPLSQRQRTQIVSIQFKCVVEADMDRILADHGARYALAVEPLL